MASESLGESLGIREELIKKASVLAFKAHKSPEKPYHLEKIRTSGPSEYIFSFPGSWVVSDWYAEKDFGETKINLSLFPSLRSIGNDEPGFVNKAFLRRFDAILSNSSLKSDVNKAMTEKKRIVFTGHSSGAPMAILASLWTLEQYPNPLNPPFCVTFGSPLIGNHIFSHATRRENWSRYFIHFVMRYDVVPRISLAPISSIEETITPILQLFNPKSKSSDSIKFSEFYNAVMKNAAAVTSHRACILMGSTNLLLETVTNMIVLSPYRPFGTFVFCTGNGRLVVVKNSEAVLQVLFHRGLWSDGEEGDEGAPERVFQHLAYVGEVQDSLGMQNVVCLEKLEDVPLSGDKVSIAGDAATLDMALNDLGLGTRARLCLRAAGELEKQKRRNEAKIDKAKMKEGGNEAKIDKDKSQNAMKDLEDYKEVTRIQGVGYYDAFKLQKEERDFKANVKRLELAGVWDEIIEMLKRYELPDEFEGKQEWIDLGTKFRRLVEPLDIANYYRHSKDEDTGPYMIKGRPKRYKYTQRWLEHQKRMAKEAISESCFWAEMEELSSKKNKGLSDEDFKKRVVKLEQDLQRWRERREVPTEVFVENSSFMKWWKNLPKEYKAGILQC